MSGHSKGLFRWVVIVKAYSDEWSMVKVYSIHSLVFVWLHSPQWGFVGWVAHSEAPVVHEEQPHWLWYRLLGAVGHLPPFLSHIYLLCVRVCICVWQKVCVCVCVCACMHVCVHVHLPVYVCYQGSHCNCSQRRVFQSVQMGRVCCVFSFSFFCAKALVSQDFISIQHCDCKDWHFLSYCKITWLWTLESRGTNSQSSQWHKVDLLHKPMALQTSSTNVTNNDQSIMWMKSGGGVGVGVLIEQQLLS